MMTDLSTPVAAVPSLQRKFEGRALRSLVLTTLVWAGALLASVPLISVLYMLITRGGARLSLEVFTELPPTGFETGGGFGNAMAGTFVMVGIAAAIAVPVGIMAAVFLAELGPHSRLANAARFAAKMLTGLPSILAGVFAYALVVMTTGTMHVLMSHFFLVCRTYIFNGCFENNTLTGPRMIAIHDYFPICNIRYCI